jgi:hypothetical protein
VAVHEAIEKTDGVVFRCTLSGCDADRWLEVPAWMFERASCPDFAFVTAAPFADMTALSALAGLLEQTLKDRKASSNAPLSGASRSSHDQIRGRSITAPISASGSKPKPAMAKERTEARPPVWRGDPQQMDLFGSEPHTNMPAWRELPRETQATLTSLMTHPDASKNCWSNRQ